MEIQRDVATKVLTSSCVVPDINHYSANVENMVSS